MLPELSISSGSVEDKQGEGAGLDRAGLSYRQNPANFLK